MRIRILFLCMIFLVSCQPASMEDFQAAGAVRVRLLLKDLRSIESREDLALMEPVLKKHFDKIVDLLISARSFQQKKQIRNSEIYFFLNNQILNESLLGELKRIYGLEGGRECIEKAEKEAMLRLDAHEKLVAKQKENYFN